MGLVSLSGFPLFANEPRYALESVGSIHMDEHFDPEGWL